MLGHIKLFQLTLKASCYCFDLRHRATYISIIAVVDRRRCCIYQNTQQAKLNVKIPILQTDLPVSFLLQWSV